jgi:hypothetical protein
MPSCSTLETVFLATFACAVLGNILGVLAWRHRRPDLDRKRWLVDPTYLFRTSYYQVSAVKFRYPAIGLQLLGAAGVLWLVYYLITASRSGLPGLCGFSF